MLDGGWQFPSSTASIRPTLSQSAVSVVFKKLKQTFRADSVRINIGGIGLSAMLSKVFSLNVLRDHI